MMTSRERLLKLFNGEKIDRVPFAPAIYEHKAFLIGRTPSETAQSEELMVRGMEKEIEIYSPDLITVGLDVYNVEAEAMGAEVKYFESNDIPGIKGPVIKEKSDLKNLQVPDPETAGRMPLFLSASESLQSKYGKDKIIRGAVSGPFSMASELYSFDMLLMDTIMDPEFVSDLLSFCTDVCFTFSTAYRKRNVDVIVFDSRCAPPLISPDIYDNSVLGYHKKLFACLKDLGQSIFPLIIGGDTTPMAESLFKSGANLILSDFPADFDRFIDLAGKYDTLLRRNIDPGIIQNGPSEKIKEEVETVLSQGSKYDKLVLGTGVTPYDTPVEHVLAVKEAVLEKGVK